jgi:hypothetical protein
MAVTPTPAAPVAPATNTIVRVANDANDLYNAAEQDPTAKADLETLFDSISHGGAISPGLMAYLVTAIGADLQQHGITLDSQLLSLLIGVLVSAVSYLWQWLMIKINKPETN